MLHGWTDEHCLKLLKNCWEALPENGKVIIVESILPLVPENQASSHIVFEQDLFMLAQTTGGRERSKKEYEALAKNSGFSGLEIVCCAYNSWVMEFHKWSSTLVADHSETSISINRLCAITPCILSILNNDVELSLCIIWTIFFLFWEFKFFSLLWHKQLLVEDIWWVLSPKELLLHLSVTLLCNTVFNKRYLQSNSALGAELYLGCIQPDHGQYSEHS